MVALRLVGQHVLVDIATTIHLCECGGCERYGGYGRCGEGCLYIYSRGECLQVGVNVCTVKCDRQEHKLNITIIYLLAD